MPPKIIFNRNEEIMKLINRIRKYEKAEDLTYGERFALLELQAKVIIETTPEVDKELSDLIKGIKQRVYSEDV